MDANEYFYVLTLTWRDDDNVQRWATATGTRIDEAGLRRIIREEIAAAFSTHALAAEREPSTDSDIIDRRAYQVVGEVDGLTAELLLTHAADCAQVTRDSKDRTWCTCQHGEDCPALQCVYEWDADEVCHCSPKC